MKTKTIYIPVSVADELPEKDGFYYTLIGDETGNNWFKNGKWLDEILGKRESAITHWLKPVPLDTIIDQAFE
jgi:hypothetical protein